MATTVDCPACQRKLRVPDNLVGKQVRCPSCGDTFPAGTPPELPPVSSQPETLALPPGAVPTDSSMLESGATGAPSPAQEKVTSAPVSSIPAKREGEDDHEYCPRCNEQIQRGERRCRHCGKELDDQDDRPWEKGAVRRDSEPHRGPLVLTLGIVSIACGALSLMGCFCLSVFGLGAGIPAWVMGHRDLKQMRQGVRDPSGERQTRGGWICSIVGTILSSLGVLITIFMIIFETVFITSMMSAGKPVAPPATNVAPAKGR